MNNQNLDQKLRRVLQKLSEPGYSPPGNFYLESLLTHLTKADGNTKLAIESSIVTDWIISSASLWNTTLLKSDRHVQSFFLRLTAAATEKPDTFQTLHQGNVYENIFSRGKIVDQTNPSLKLGYLQVLLALTQHEVGLKWIVQKELWKQIVLHCQTQHTVYLQRLGTQLLATFLWKLNDLNSNVTCNEVLKALLEPILENKWKSATEISDYEHSQMDDALIPSVTALAEVLEDVEHFGRSNLIITAVNKTFDLDRHLVQLFHISRSTLLVGCISKLLYLTRLGDVYITKSSPDDLTQSDIVELCKAYKSMILSLLAKRDWANILYLSHFCYIFTSKVRDRHKLVLRIERDEGSFEITNQIMIISILPLLCSVKDVKHEFIDLYIGKLISISCEQTTRMAYSFKDLLREKNDSKIVIKAIQYAIAIKKYLSKAQAVILFQSFFYSLQDFVPVDEELGYVVVGADNWEAADLISKLLDAIFIYIEEFDILWQDSVEVLCVHNFCVRIIKTSNLDTKLTLLAFKLAQLTIRRFLSPNLALLTNSSDGSIISEIGHNIYTKLHDPVWEVRDSALELLCIVTDIAAYKFPAFQQQLCGELPGLVVTLSRSDGEAYVRAAALKCVAAMVGIACVWDKHLHCMHLPEKAMKVLRDEPEGLVRKEAAQVMINIYEHQKFPADMLDRVFVTMHHAAVKDLHWEVQVTALAFWSKVIHSQLSHQGMIDGVFPAVTFSKENRKIVQLNEKEIKKRLKNVLNELALRGCLKALLSCLKDEDADLEVMAKALEVICEITDLLDQYNVTDLSQSNGSSDIIIRPIIDEQVMKDHQDMGIVGVARNKADLRSETNNIILCGDNMEDCDKVIDSIVDCKDINLLSGVYCDPSQAEYEADCDMNGDVDITVGDADNMAGIVLDPVEFLRDVRETNYKKTLEEKLRWRANITTNVGSLFDDILANYQPTEANSLDCY